MFKATFENEEKLTIRQQNFYVDACELTLKKSTYDYKCLAKKKIQTKNKLIVEIIYATTGHRKKSLES